jgi:hypothetical protein
LSQDPLTFISVTTIIVALSLLSGWLAGRTTRRYGFAKTERRWWIALAILLGPAGLLALYSVREWPVREPCGVCGEPRAVDLVNCPKCDSGLEPPVQDGTEIITTPSLSV